MLSALSLAHITLWLNCDWQYKQIMCDLDLERRYQWQTCSCSVYFGGTGHESKDNAGFPVLDRETWGNALTSK